MTLFPHNELRNAFLFSGNGNQALLLCKKHPRAIAECAEMELAL